MHEIGLCQDVLEAVERHAAGRRVVALTVRAGAGLHVVPDVFSQSFAMVAAGTVAEGATVEVVLDPVRGRCTRCGTVFETQDALVLCPACDSPRCEREGGDALVVEAIAYGSVSERS